jgi:hypothetical protein
VLQIFAERAAAELERQQFEEALAHGEERWRGFVTHGNEAIVRVDLERPISVDAPEDEQIDHYYQYGMSRIATIRRLLCSAWRMRQH